MSPDSSDNYPWRRIVVKIGTQALTSDAGVIEPAHLAAYVDQMAALRRADVEVVCVSSGAVAAGLGDLGLSRRPNDLPGLQAAAAAGQARLVEQYRTHFARHGLHVAQLLLTHADLRSRVRHLNARYTFERLLRAGVIPIVNENDTVAVEEIRVGDNDTLSALVALLVHADTLVMLTNTDGLLDADGNRLPRIDAITDDVRRLVSSSRSTLGTGGMMTKIDAADMMMSVRRQAVIARARESDVLTRLHRGDDLGTRFTPADDGSRRLTGRKRWIAFFDHPQGDLHLDNGAVRAVVSEGRSLLAVGLRAVTGSFDPGAPVRLLDECGNEVARGLTNYDATSLMRIAGVSSDRIASILGRQIYDEVIHRDNLAVLNTPPDTDSRDDPS